MAKEIKISLPLYKIGYAVFFVVILSLIRGVTATYEIGIALETPMALLAAAFCADTYTQEIASKRSEIHRLYPIKKRKRSLISRMFVQEIFLFLLAAAGYGLFFAFQKPMGGTAGETEQYLVFLFAAAATFLFWGMLSNTLAMLFRNMWFGIGGSLILWLITNSTLGEHLFGPWNLFSYTFRNVENGDLTWMRGKIISICFSILMIGILPNIIKKRG